MTRPNTQVMNRAALTARIVGRCTAGEAIVGGIGNTNWDLWGAAGERAENFYMLGSMGLALPIALGVALAQPARRVVALEGDGSLLMQLGCLSTIAARRPRNLIVVVWDNGIYQITGGQATPAQAAGTDLVAIARASGIARAHWAADEAEFEALFAAAQAEDGPHFLAARIDDAPGRLQTPREPVRHASAFMAAMGRGAG
jgi:thiamine pyrophosphate-dependent acetolactate synthase large subunit-like protein